MIEEWYNGIIIKNPCSSLTAPIRIRKIKKACKYLNWVWCEPNYSHGRSHFNTEKYKNI